jgi:hydrogenase nickel incorporation protein HypA/HybF
VDGTPLQGSVLVVHDVPVTVFCGSCDDVVELSSVTAFVCSRCGEPSGDVRGGREIELVQLVVDEAPAATSDDADPVLGTGSPVPA